MRSPPRSSDSTPYGDGRIGLHISRRLLSAEGGEINVELRRSDAHGCTVSIELPIDVENQPNALDRSAVLLRTT